MNALRRNWDEALLMVVLALVFVYAIVHAYPMPFHARWFPLLVGALGVLVTAILLVRQLLRPTTGQWAMSQAVAERAVGVSTDVREEPQAVEAAKNAEDVLAGVEARKMVRAGGWIVGYLLVIVVFGLLIGSAPYIVAYIVAKGGRLVSAAVISAAAVGFTYLVFSDLLMVPMPTGLLF